MTEFTRQRIKKELQVLLTNSKEATGRETDSENKLRRVLNEKYKSETTLNWLSIEHGRSLLRMELITANSKYVKRTEKKAQDVDY